MDWHYADGDQTVGPISVEELERLFRAGKINAKTLVWSEGMSGWQAVEECSSLSHLLSKTPPPLPSAAKEPVEPEIPTAIPETGISDWKQLAGPWTRYFARIIDIFVLSALVSLAAFTAAPFVSLELSLALNRVNPYLLNLIVLPFGFMLNAAVVTLFGNSLGKVIFGIKMVPLGAGQTFSFRDNFAREMRVWGQGLGLGIPIVTLFTAISAFKKVSAGKATNYDEGVANVYDLSGNKVRRAIGMLLAGAMLVGGTIFNAMDRQAVENMARPSKWTNPVTQRQATIPAYWQYEFITGPDNNPLYTFTQMQTGRVAIMGVEDFSATDLEEYSHALGTALSENMTLVGWERSDVANGLLENSGWVNDGDKPVIIYTLQQSESFWRIVVIDQVRPLPNDNGHIALVTALLDSIGFR